MYRNIISFLLVVGYGLYAHSQQLPLVYDQEHTGSHYAPPLRCLATTNYQNVRICQIL